MGQLRLPKKLFLLLPTEIWTIIGKIINKDFAHRVFRLEKILEFPADEDWPYGIHSGPNFVQSDFLTEYHSWSINDIEIEHRCLDIDILWTKFNDTFETNGHWFAVVYCNCHAYTFEGDDEEENIVTHQEYTCTHKTCDLVKSNDWERFWKT